ncbi:MAG: M23 family metallopeptidase [Defluviitaleaceae bacterium]|nr:M23 family metallopeptidase [Defluviitaleaceae bacterium]
MGITEGLSVIDYPEYFYNDELPLWINPVTGRISSPAGMRDNPITGLREFHDGVDIAIPTGTPIVAPKDGTVVAAGFSPSFGYFMRIAHDNSLYTTFYAHLSRPWAVIGDIVTQGTLIAYSGNTGMSTGPHLHFSIFYDGQFIDPMTRLDFVS